jgi:hypothetical protein
MAGRMLKISVPNAGSLEDSINLVFEQLIYILPFIVAICL